MCDKVILENGGMLKFISEYKKAQKCKIKLVDNYSLLRQFDSRNV